MKSATINRDSVRRRALKSLFAHEMDDVRDLGQLIERLLKKEVESLSAMINGKTSCLPFPDRDELLGWYDGDVYQLSREFPRIQRYALFATVMGMIENHLHFLCKHAQQVCNIEIAASDLNGKGAIRSITYLTKACRFRIRTGLSSEIDHLTMMQKIRNVIVHSDGILPDNELATIQQYRKRCPHFDISDRNQIQPRESFLNIVIHIAQLLFTVIIAEIEEAERRAQQGGGEVRLTLRGQSPLTADVCARHGARLKG